MKELVGELISEDDLAPGVAEADDLRFLEAFGSSPDSYMLPVIGRGAGLSGQYFWI